MFRELIQQNRSYRRFDENFVLSREILTGLVDLARLSPSGANLQPLKYILSSETEKNQLIFPHLHWAGYLQDWKGPEEGERPGGYIIILGDTGISRSFGCDHGIAAQSILLGATEMGLGGCIIGSIDRGSLREALEIPAEFELLMIIALGKPAETIRIEAVDKDGSVRYWRDEKKIHHVPKRSLEEIIVG